MGKLHHVKEEAREKWGELKDTGVKASVKKNVEMLRSKVIRGVNAGEDYDHHYRRKTRWRATKVKIPELTSCCRRELVKISAAVMGIEFAYAAETAFVSPTLLKIGVSQVQQSLLCRTALCFPVPHDPDLVPLPPGRLPPHPRAGLPLGPLPVPARPPQTLHPHPLARGGPRYRATLSSLPCVY